MVISRVHADLLRLPLPRPRALPRAEDCGPPPPDAINVLLVRLETDDGLSGLGVAYDLTAAASHCRLACAAVEQQITPRLIGADPRRHQRICAQLRHDVSTAVNIALAAVDVAVWDLAAKVADMPLWHFLGSARDTAPAYAAETAWPGLGGEQILAVYESARAKGLAGLHVAVGGPSPEADARKLELVRNEVGLEAWLGVTGNNAYDTGTALAMGRFLEEELDADWFEDPVPADDRAGLRRLADKLELPVAVGGRFDRSSDFAGWLSETAAGIVRPDPVRLGGLTPTVHVVNLAAAFHRPAVPVLLPEVGVHLACGLPGARAVDYVSWLEPLWQSPLVVVGGSIAAPPGPGLGLELNAGAVERFRIGP